jgi:integrase
MRVRLKGVNRVRKRLANGLHKTYYYAWKGGPRLEGKPGSPEFHASYCAATEGRSHAPKDQLVSIIEQYRGSSAYSDLSPRSRHDYHRLLLKIEKDFGDFPLDALRDPRTRGEFLAWRDRNALKSRRQADYAFAVLARVMSWAYNRGIITLNPCERGGRVYRAKRADRVWKHEDEAAFFNSAPKHLHLPLKLALWTGQRHKTGAVVQIPLGQMLLEELQALQLHRKTANENYHTETILLNSRGQAWTESGFQASWRKACIAAGIKNLTFHDLRGTAVTRLAQAGCTVPEIATISGHSLKDVASILDSHYLHRDQSMAQSAIRKLEHLHSLSVGICQNR